MLKLLVLADDFTGALDTGVQFSSQGIQTMVTTDKAIDFTKIADNVEVLVIDTESRYLSFDDSYETIQKIVKHAKSAGISRYYKKIDSALRGNVSSEIKALLDAFPEENLALVPAYPAIQRVVRNGKLFIDNVLVSESIFAKDPYEPVIESDIAKRLNLEAGIELSLSGSKDFPIFDKQLILFDSETDEDLRDIAAYLHQNNKLQIAIGCAGFAKYLVKQLFSEEEVQIPQLTAPLVVICGSVNHITRRQIDFAEQKGNLRISLSAQELLDTGYWYSIEGQEKLATYIPSIQNADLAIFETLSEETTRDILAYGEDKRLDRNDIRFRIGKSLGELTEQLFEKRLDRTYLFTGGDTLYQTMEVLKIDQIKPICEIGSGIVLAELKWKDQVISVITKSGGFGQPELFEDIKQMIKKEEVYVS